MAANPESFLHLIKPTWEDEDLTQDERQLKVRENFLKFVSSDRAETDRSAYYIYQLIKPDGEQVKGLIGLVSIDDYEEGKLRNTRKH